MVSILKKQNIDQRDPLPRCWDEADGGEGLSHLSDVSEGTALLLACVLPLCP
jgi:hypothetical protein